MNILPSPKWFHVLGTLPSSCTTIWCEGIKQSRTFPYLSLEPSQSSRLNEEQNIIFIICEAYIGECGLYLWENRPKWTLQDMLDLSTSSHTELNQPSPFSEAESVPILFMSLRNNAKYFFSSQGPVSKGKENGIRGKALDDWRFTFFYSEIG